MNTCTFYQKIFQKSDVAVLHVVKASVLKQQALIALTVEGLISLQARMDKHDVQKMVVRPPAL